MADKPFTTSDFGLATYLVTQGMEFIRAVKRKDNQRASFVFIDQENRDELVENWSTGQDMVSASYYNRKTKLIRDAIRESFEVEE